MSVTCDLAKLYPPESLEVGNYTLEVNYSHFFDIKPPGINLFQGSISAVSIPIVIAAPIATHIITTEAGAGGGIFLSNSGASGHVVVRDGSEPTFIITPNSGFVVGDVQVDGSSKGAVTSYTFPPVFIYHTIAANFTSGIFSGFFPPVYNPDVVNKAKAGKAIPVKWQLKDANGEGISSPSSFGGLTSYSVGCSSFSGDPTSPIVDVETTGSSGLQYLGNGNWQYNWKTPKDYVGSCRKMVLTLSDGTKHTANFEFTK